MTLYTHEIISKIFKDYRNLRKEFKDEVIASTAATRENRSRARDREAKEFSQDMARNLWAKDNSETITGLATYIRNLLVDEGFRKYAQDTVRDWIKDLAPLERHMPGRPASQPASHSIPSPYLKKPGSTDRPSFHFSHAAIK